MKDLKNKVVLITGAGGGIGRAIAQEFKAAGAKLVLTDLTPVLPALKRDFPDAMVEALNVTDAKAVLKLRDLVLKKMGAVHVLVNNAGTVYGGALCDVSLERHRFTYELNTLAPVTMTHAFLPSMLSAESHLVYIASASGFIGLPFGSTYASSKWGLIGFAESIRNELNTKHLPVSVSIICPSYVDTGLFAGARGPWLTPILRPEDVGRAVLKSVQNKRVYTKMPWSVYLINAARVLLPLSWFDWFMRATGTSESMSGWKGHTA